MAIELPHRILIIGLGLMGGSIADALSKKDYEVHAITRKQETIDYAKKHGLIKDGTTEITREYISSFSVVIFGLYPDTLVEWLEQYHDYFAPGALLTDVTGVKCPIMKQIEPIIQNDDVDFVYAHPMAGREVYGVQNATRAIFRSANFIVTPLPHNKQENIERIKLLGEEIGSAHIAVLSPETHDEMIAYLSQLTHVIAVALMNAKDNSNLAEYTGNSFRDLTRIANINEDMWTELFLLNKEQLLKQIDLFMGEMASIRTAISTSDEETLKKMMRQSSVRQLAFHR